MKIYLICPVRRANPEQQADLDSIVAGLEKAGHSVHYPPRDVDQKDDTGVKILKAHFEAMKACDTVYVYWDSDSKGSHYDVGMAFALQKPLVVIHVLNEDPPGKSFLKVMDNWPWGMSL